MGVQDGQSRFLVERLARATGVTRLTVAVLDDERYAPYLFVLAATLLERPIRLPSTVRSPLFVDRYCGRSEPRNRWAG